MKRGIRQNAILQWVIEAGKPIYGDELMDHVGAAPSSRRELNKRIHRMVHTGVLGLDEKGRLFAPGSKNSSQNSSSSVDNQLQNNGTPSFHQKRNRFSDEGRSRDNRFSDEGRSKDNRFSNEGRSRDNRFTNEGRSKDKRFTNEGRSRDNHFSNEGRSRDNRFSNEGRSRDKRFSNEGQNRGKRFSSESRKRGTLQFENQDAAPSSRWNPDSVTPKSERLSTLGGKKLFQSQRYSSEQGAKAETSFGLTQDLLDQKTRVGRLIFVSGKPHVQFRGGKEKPKPLSLKGWEHLSEGELLSVTKVSPESSVSSANTDLNSVGKPQDSGVSSQEQGTAELATELQVNLPTKAGKSKSKKVKSKIESVSSSPTADTVQINEQIDSTLLVSNQTTSENNLVPEYEILARVGEAQSFAEVVQEFYREFGVNPHYPKKAVQFAEQMAQDAMKSSLPGRLDCTQQWVVVIDPLGARDHDDACFVEKNPQGGWTLYVHIADVSEFVTEGTPLDEAALRRSFTRYFPWGSVPMLPEVLSAQVCSLRQDEARKALSCKMEVDEQGKLGKYEFFESWIRVAQFLTYEEAMDAHKAGNKQVELLAEVADALHAKRERDLIFLFDLPEPRFKLGPQGEPLAMLGRNHLPSHSWIEECMLAANSCCATFLVKNRLPGMHRVHEPPEVEEVRTVLHISELISQVVGRDKLPVMRKIPTQPQEMRQLYASLLNNKNLTAAGALLPHMQTKLLRTMKKANYNTNSLGHFALGWDLYAHFTSPIRRYPDLWNHRLIKMALLGKKIPVSLKTEALEACEHINDTEIDIMKLERKSHRAAMAWIMRDYLGEVFDCQVSSIDGKGLAVFIHTEDIYGEIWNPLSRLGNDYYDYSETEEVLVGRRNGAMIRMGDNIKVRVVQTSPGRAEIDLEFLI